MRDDDTALLTIREQSLLIESRSMEFSAPVSIELPLDVVDMANFERLPIASLKALM